MKWCFVIFRVNSWMVFSARKEWIHEITRIGTKEISVKQDLRNVI